jgi:hypothetical protein
MKTLISASVCLAFAAIATACMIEEEPAMQPASTRMVTSNSEAARRVSEAGCDREAACTGFGAGKRFIDRQACTNALGSESWNKFSNCTYGVKERDLGACVNEVRTQSCGGLSGPIDWLDRALVCRTNDLCLD